MIGQLTIPSSKLSMRKSPIGAPPPIGSAFNPLTGKLEPIGGPTAQSQLLLMQKQQGQTQYGLYPSGQPSQASYSYSPGSVQGTGAKYVIDIGAGTPAAKRRATTNDPILDYQAQGGWADSMRKAYEAAEKQVMDAAAEPTQRAAVASPSYALTAAQGPGYSATSTEEAVTQDVMAEQPGIVPASASVAARVGEGESKGISPLLIVGIGVLAFLMFRGR